VEQELYIDIPKGCVIGNQNNKDYALKVLKNIYGQKQAGKVWHDFLINGLTTPLGFTQSIVDPCMLWRKSVILIIYTDDTIITGANPRDINTAIADIATIFEITSKSNVSDFLGVNIDLHDDDTITLSQPQLIQTILDNLHLKEDSNTLPIPAPSTKILHAYKDSEDHRETWHYRSIIGKLNFLAQSARPDIAYAVHQCARFSASPKIEHSKAIKAIGRYLAGTKHQGLICKINNHGLECYSDADFAGNWNQDIAVDDDSTARSRTGYIILFAGFPLIWVAAYKLRLH
jgi:Reverse transcriptase (RNA-dependent DNA polymerase)